MNLKDLYSSRGFKVALIALPIFIGALDLTVVSAVLPHVILDLKIPLQTGLDDAAWIVTGYLLAYSLSMTFMGRLSDLYGRRRVYLAALVIFGLGSFLVAVAHLWPTRLALRGYYLVASGRPDVSYVTLYVLIAARMIQAFGAGTMVPVGMALVGDLYPAGQRARPLGINAAVDTAGWVVVHLYGGIIVRFWSWQMIFWLNLPFCLIAFVLIWVLLRGAEEVHRREGRMDWLGALLITLCLTMFNLALGSGSEASTSASLAGEANLSDYMIPLLVAALVAAGLFVWRQRRTDSPLVDLDLFKLPGYRPASLANFLVGVAMFIAIANVPLFINSLIAESAEQGAWDSGWMLSALTVPMALAAVPGGWLADKRGYRLPSITGLLMAVAGFLVMTQWTAQTTYAGMAPALTFTGIGFGLIMAPVAAAVINASPEEHRGTSSALVIIFRLIGMTIGVSGITTYGLRRVNFLNKQLIQPDMDFQAMLVTTMHVTERVISETFIIAAVVTALAIIPAMMLRGRSKNAAPAAPPPKSPTDHSPR
ncbi:MAG: MFS transporter [Anaerolineales bacterium]